MSLFREQGAKGYIMWNMQRLLPILAVAVMLVLAASVAFDLVVAGSAVAVSVERVLIWLVIVVLILVSVRPILLECRRDLRMAY